MSEFVPRQDQEPYLTPLKISVEGKVPDGIEEKIGQAIRLVFQGRGYTGFPPEVAISEDFATANNGHVGSGMVEVSTSEGSGQPIVTLRVGIGDSQRILAGMAIWNFPLTAEQSAISAEAAACWVAAHEASDYVDWRRGIEHPVLALSFSEVDLDREIAHEQSWTERRSDRVATEVVQAMFGIRVEINRDATALIYRFVRVLGRIRGERLNREMKWEKVDR